MYLKVGGLVGKVGVADGVRLIEGVAGEFLPPFPDSEHLVAGLPFGFAPIEEAFLELIHLLYLLLPNRLSEIIGLPCGEVCQHSREPHHLLLVHRDAIGGFEHLTNLWHIVLHGFQPMFTLDEGGDMRQRARPEEGVHGYKVVELVGLKLT